MSSLPWLAPVGAEMAAGASEEIGAIQSFRALHPLLGAAFWRGESSPSIEGDITISIKNYGGRLQVTVRVPSAAQFGFLELTDPEALWNELESALEFRSIRWQVDGGGRKKRS